MDRVIDSYYLIIKKRKKMSVSSVSLFVLLLLVLAGAAVDYSPMVPGWRPSVLTQRPLMASQNRTVPSRDADVSRLPVGLVPT